MAPPCCAAAPASCTARETYVLQDEHGQISESWSVSAGLDYPAVGPEHAFLKDSGRAEYVGATDHEALDAFALLARSEGIICAFESAHALAHALKLAEEAREDMILVVNLSGPRRQGHGAGPAPAGTIGMSARYAAMFDRLEARGEGAFGAFVMLGDPDLATSAAILDALVEGGADMIEVGIPFSDPDRRRPDHPGRGRAGARARASRRPIVSACSPTSAAAIRDVPVGILTYANLVARPRAATPSTARRPRRASTACWSPTCRASRPPPFVAAATRAGVDAGPDRRRQHAAADARADRPARRRLHLLRRARRRHRRRARDGARPSRPVRRARGARRAAADPRLRHLRRPTMSAQALAAGAAGVISGSAIVKRIEQGDLQAVRSFVAEMKAATRA